MGQSNSKSGQTAGTSKGMVASETGCMYCWGSGVTWDEQIKSYHVCLACGGIGTRHKEDTPHATTDA